LNQDVDEMLSSMAIQQSSGGGSAKPAPEQYPPQYPPRDSDHATASHGAGDDDDDDDGAEVSPQERVGGSLGSKPNFPPGQTGISIRIEKIQLQNAVQYLEPTITVSIYDKDGRVVAGGGPQVTPPCSRIEPAISPDQKEQSEYLVFNTEVHLQLPLHLIPKSAAVFFELKHFKAAKSRVSTKCFSFLEHDEIERPGAIPMELYQKPSDYKRRKLNLMTDKEHYLHVVITRHQEN
jgi:hypothetical protein